MIRSSQGRHGRLSRARGRQKFSFGYVSRGITKLSVMNRTKSREHSIPAHCY